MNKLLIISWSLAFFMGGICLDEATQKPVIVHHTKTVPVIQKEYVKQPTFIPVKPGVHFNQQEEEGAFSILASAVQPARHR